MKVDCWACYNNINEEDRYKAHNLEKKSLMDVSGHSPFINNNNKKNKNKNKNKKNFIV